MSRNTADAIIIGGGIIGSSISYQLTRHGIKNVIQLEKGNAVGQGSSGSSSAVIRSRYTWNEVASLAWYGTQAFRNWNDFLELKEVKGKMEKIGVLWLMQESKELLEKETKRLRSLGIKTSILDLQQLKEAYPGISPCQVDLDLTGEIEHFCKDSEYFFLENDGGYADPLAATEDFLAAAINGGARIEYKQKVTELSMEGGKIKGLKTDRGDSFEAPVIVNAAGPWCNQINLMAGIELPWDLKATRVQVCVRDCPPDAKGKIPVFVDKAGGVYGRPEAGGGQILYGSILTEDEEEYIDDPDNFNTDCDPDYRDSKLHSVHHRIFGCKGRGNATGYSGLYTVNTQDMHPLLGKTSLDGYFIANGFSGHGFKLSPAIGSLMARIITEQKINSDTHVDPDFLSVNRKPIHLDVKNVLA